MTKGRKRRNSEYQDGMDGNGIWRRAINTNLFQPRLQRSWGSLLACSSLDNGHAPSVTSRDFDFHTCHVRQYRRHMGPPPLPRDTPRIVLCITLPVPIVDNAWFPAGTKVPNASSRLHIAGILPMRYEASSGGRGGVDVDKWKIYPQPQSMAELHHKGWSVASVTVT